MLFYETHVYDIIAIKLITFQEALYLSIMLNKAFCRYIKDG